MKVTLKRKNVLLPSELEGAQFLFPSEKKKRGALERHARRTSISRAPHAGRMMSSEPPHLHFLFWYDDALMVANSARAYASKLTLHRVMGGGLFYWQAYRAHVLSIYKENHVPQEDGSTGDLVEADPLRGSRRKTKRCLYYLAKYISKADGHEKITSGV